MLALLQNQYFVNLVVNGANQVDLWEGGKQLLGMDKTPVLKCHSMVKFSMPIFFLHFRTQSRVCPRYLTKFRSVTNIRMHVFWTFFGKLLKLQSL